MFVVYEQEDLNDMIVLLMLCSLSKLISSVEFDKYKHLLIMIDELKSMFIIELIKEKFDKIIKLVDLRVKFDDSKFNNPM